MTEKCQAHHACECIIREAMAYQEFYKARKNLEEQLHRLGQASARHDSRDCISLIDRTVAKAMDRLAKAEEAIKALVAGV